MNRGDPQFISFFWLFLAAFVVALMARKVRIPYALALVITGLAIGIPRLLPQAHLDPKLLFTVFLPPLLFEAAINLPAEALKRDWKLLAVYTFAGTILSTFIIGALTAWALNITLPVGLVFGALISTTDPISVIAIFRRLGTGRRLTLLLEAESLFNNDTAVVLFTVMMSVVVGGHVSIGGSIWQFLRLVIGGAAVGLALGFVASRVHYDLNDHLVEITLTTVVAFGSYVCAEAIHASGVMAVIVAGLVIGNHGMQTAMSPGTRLAVHAFWEYAAFVVNSIVFLLIGIEVAYVPWADKTGLAIGAVAIVLAGRAAIYPLSAIVNRLKGRIPLSWQHVLFWGGLRGALSMALVLGLDRGFPHRDSLVAATFGVVVFSLLVQGSTLGPLIRKLGLAGVEAANPREQQRLATEIMAVQAALFELDRLRAAEAHPNWSVEMLTNEYRARLAHLEADMETLAPDYRRLQREQSVGARRLALQAEKSAWQEAERQGWLEEEDWRNVAARLDAELVALRTQETGRE